MTDRHPFLEAILLAAILAACGNNKATTPDKPCTVTIDPPATTLLTCSSKKLTATVAGACSPAVHWTASAGTVDGTGLYTTPNKLPSPASATVTAADTEVATASGQAAITLAEMVPGTAALTGLSGEDTVFPHQVAASGSRVYALQTSITSSASSYVLNVAASSDGGKTFAAPVRVNDSNTSVAISGAALAVDAGDPNTVYVVYQLETGIITKTADAVPVQSTTTLALAVSTDGGAHWTNYVLESHQSTFGNWPDVISPAPGTVLVVCPANSPTVALMSYRDTNKGTGFANGVNSGAAGYVVNGATVFPSYPHVGFGGGSFGSESPRLFGDGNGKVCLTYLGYPASGDTTVRVVAQCSANGGLSFGSPNDYEFDSATGSVHHPFGAFGNGGFSLTWWRQNGTTSDLRLSHSDDLNGTFTAPATIPAYQAPASTGQVTYPSYPTIVFQGPVLWLSYYGSSMNFGRVIADKSCDGGATWSGPVLLNGPEPSPADGTWGGIALGSNGPFVFNRYGSPGNNDPQKIIQLAP